MKDVAEAPLAGLQQLLSLLTIAFLMVVVCSIVILKINFTELSVLINIIIAV